MRHWLNWTKLNNWSHLLWTPHKAWLLWTTLFNCIPKQANQPSKNHDVTTKNGDKLQRKTSQTAARLNKTFLCAKARIKAGRNCVWTWVRLGHLFLEVPGSSWNFLELLPNQLIEEERRKELKWNHSVVLTSRTSYISVNDYKQTSATELTYSNTFNNLVSLTVTH